MDWLHAVFQKTPETALFMSLTAGYLIGQIRFGRFRIGGVAGRGGRGYGRHKHRHAKAAGVFARRGINHTTIAALRSTVDRDMRHGVYLQAISRAGLPLPVLPETRLEHGDVLTFFGSPQDTQRAVDAAGYELPYSDKTDFIYMGAGIVIGLLMGLIVVRVGGVAFTLGSGGRYLVAGLVFGWMRGKHSMMGVMPPAASQLLKDFGLAAFVAVVGLNAGLQAVAIVQRSRASIVVLGIVVTLLPLLLTMLFGRYVLRYDKAAVFAGALAGSRCACSAHRGVIDKAECSAPTAAFAVTYAIANVLLTLIGPLVVGLV
ncbi:putative transport protein [Candidatus Burkholderia humilis]|nr:putative transport protein [Candidatus Burkholderia humilis]